MNVLLVEDEARVADFISRGLKGEGLSVTLAPDGETALEFLKENTFDVVVLDLMLPGISGQDVCRRMRARKDLTPVLMLSALDETVDRIVGLNIGADDYLAKPFDFDELIARLKALNRRQKYSSQSGVRESTLTCGRISFDRTSFIITTGGAPVDLSEKERDMLAVFMLNVGKVLARERILNSVWGADCDPLTNVIDVYVGRLRRKLNLDKNELKNIRGIGYRFLPAESPDVDNCVHNQSET